MELDDVDPGLIEVVDGVCSALLDRAQGLRSTDLMVVGAYCRDALQSSWGQDLRLRGTIDLDLAIALADWRSYEELADRLPRRGGTGIQFEVERVQTDLLPFGHVEEPPGTVRPASRVEPLSVWGFTEVFEQADTLLLPRSGAIRIPTVAGYVGLKLAAWLDRSADGEYKDAPDIAAALLWYEKSEDVVARLYQDEDLLLACELDHGRGASHLLGRDVALTLGPERSADLRARWPGGREDTLPLEMVLPLVGEWPRRLESRWERLHAFEDGAGLPRSGTAYRR